MNIKHRINKIVSGGQTGADRAGLDWAIANQLPHGGWCPKHRLAEDGRIPAKYQVDECWSCDYLVRTEFNVAYSDGTVIFTQNTRLTGGSKRTAGFAKKHHKPYLHLSQERDGLQAAQKLAAFFVQHNIKVLNVAGSRASKAPQVGQFVQQTLSQALAE